MGPGCCWSISELVEQGWEEKERIIIRENRLLPRSFLVLFKCRLKLPNDPLDTGSIVGFSLQNYVQPEF